MSASSLIYARERAVRGAFPVLLWIVLLLGACSVATRRIERDPFYESFFEKTRLIMTGEEVQIYKHLPDTRAREEFIDEFWRKRDPVPETDENEAKAEFERRIAYANRWFKENRALGRGWDTPRGRILLQLGEPDNRYLNEMINDPGVKGYERWVYYNYQLELIFIDSQGFGEFKLHSWPAELLTAIDHARTALMPVERDAQKRALTFQASYRDGRIFISIPLKGIHFREEGETIRADYKITVIAYLNFEKTGSSNFRRQLSYPRDALPSKKAIAIDLPYPLEGKGKYYLEVVMQDILTGSRARDFIEFKL
ncbi:MAG: GWxTD domain-containing protein [Candidatus Aminicenantes bacterium]|nr:GWxTD domain-containing protein [Candidatus Aminicenantes bacterium]